MYRHTVVTLSLEDGFRRNVHMSHGNSFIVVLLESQIWGGSSDGARCLFFDRADMSACAPSARGHVGMVAPGLHMSERRHRDGTPIGRESNADSVSGCGT